jgi:DnaJ like chaperone protein
VFRIAPEDEAAAARVFNLARQDVAGFDVYARRIAAMFRDQPQVLEDILEGLFQIALADGRYHEGEEAFLDTVGEIFGIAPIAFACIEARHLEGRRQDPWAVLGLPRDADLGRVRARWRELVRANHPDKMIARGLPPETVNLANARLAQINHAWEEISARRREPEPVA